MNFELIEVSFRFNAEPVTIVATNPFGGLTNFNTTQSALDAKRVDTSAPWGDDECLVIVEEQLPDKFPGVESTVSLAAAPEPIGQ